MERALANGTYSSRAELARGLGMSRARITQVLNLLDLPAEVLDILTMTGDPLPSRAMSERGLRQLAQLSQSEQVRRVRSTAQNSDRYAVSSR